MLVCLSLETNRMHNTRINNIVLNVSIRIFVLAGLFFLSAFSNVFSQNNVIKFDIDSSWAKDFDTFSPSEKQLFFIINESDSITKIDVRKSYETIKKGNLIIDFIRNKELLANYYHTYGKVLVNNEYFANGVDTLKLSLKMKKEIYGEKDSRLAKTYNYIGIAKFRLQEYEEALNNYLKSVDILKSNAFYGQDLFHAYQNIGIVKANLGNYEQAFFYFKKASGIVEQRNRNDSLSIAKFYNNYGLLATLMGKVKQANYYFNVSEEYYTLLLGGNNIHLASLSLNKGVNSFINLDYLQSTLQFNNAISIYLSIGLKGRGLVKALNNLCVLQRELGNNESSLDYGERALLYNRSEDMTLAIHKNLAQTYEKIGDFEKAQSHFDLALRIANQPTYNPGRRYQLYLLYADFLLTIDKNAKSYQYFKMALNIEGIENGYKTAKYAHVLSRIGFYYLQAEDNPEEALHYFNRSIEIWHNKLGINKNGLVSESYHSIVFADTYRGKSQTLIKLYDKKAEIKNLFLSLENYEWLLVQLERISRNLQKENQVIMREQLYPIYNEAIELSYRLFELSSNTFYQKKVFEFSEKSKSAILLSSIQNLNALKTSDISNEGQLYDQNLNEQINAVKKQLFDEKQKINPQQKKLSFFSSRLLQLLKSHDSLVYTLESDFPKYYSLKYNLSIVDFDELSRKLSNDEAFVEYQLFDSSLYIITVRNKEIFTQRLSINNSFYESVAYLANMNNSDLTMHNRDDFNAFIMHSQRLYSFLIQPIYDIIKGKRLIFVPSGMLGYLPFEILLDNSKNIRELDYKNLNFLIKEFPVSYSYSSTLRYSKYFSNPTFKKDLNILYMAPNYEKPDVNQSTQQLALKELRFAKKEVMLLQNEFGGRLISGKDAVKSSFVDLAPKYDILHLAMHTMINDSLPLYSKLVFSEEGADVNNRFLHTSEIYGLNLKASLVTLSACNTATGVLQKGEGIMSLARGFVFAGVPSVVMTLWEVQDESGLAIMNSFYSYLSDGLPKDEAMQLAKLDMLKSANMIKSHPNFWSAYIVTGDTAPLNIKNERRDVWVLLFFAIIFFMTFYLYKRAARSGGNKNLKY